MCCASFSQEGENEGRLCWKYSVLRRTLRCVFHRRVFASAFCFQISLQMAGFRHGTYVVIVLRRYFYFSNLIQAVQARRYRSCSDNNRKHLQSISPYWWLFLAASNRLCHFSLSSLGHPRCEPFDDIFVDRSSRQKMLWPDICGHDKDS